MLAGLSLAKGPEYGGVLSVILQPETVSLSPIINLGQPTSLVSGNIFDGLVYYDTKLNPQPSLAESWEISSNGLKVVFHLRKGVKWHDGHPLIPEMLNGRWKMSGKLFIPATNRFFLVWNELKLPMI
jgi:ABC-type transport system substrate-binding protein